MVGLLRCCNFVCVHYNHSTIFTLIYNLAQIGFLLAIFSSIFGFGMTKWLPVRFLRVFNYNPRH